MTEQRKQQLVGLLDNYVYLCHFADTLQTRNEGNGTLHIFDPVRDYSTFAHGYGDDERPESGYYKHGIHVYAGLRELAAAAGCEIIEDPVSDDPNPDPDFPLDDRMYFVYRDVAFFQLVGTGKLEPNRGGADNG